ncbi:hypothetical protein [Streptomyces sp. Wb2n-11]|uniref:hypothetical protein n=1 Tax=Streptomyces sp. Wb2n-11 TaxID=1030533 RepID=UPI0011462E16|nr:hypothetical protein [Streptomyces sp. Wb2n-11]
MPSRAGPAVAVGPVRAVIAPARTTVPGDRAGAVGMVPLSDTHPERFERRTDRGAVAEGETRSELPAGQQPGSAVAVSMLGKSPPMTMTAKAGAAGMMPVARAVSCWAPVPRGAGTAGGW